MEWIPTPPWTYSAQTACKYARARCTKGCTFALFLRVRLSLIPSVRSLRSSAIRGPRGLSLPLEVARSPPPLPSLSPRSNLVARQYLSRGPGLSLSSPDEHRSSGLIGTDERVETARSNEARPADWRTREMSRGNAREARVFPAWSRRVLGRARRSSI